LFTLYSPDLIATQNEYLLALRGQSHVGHESTANVQEYSARLVTAAHERLLRLDMPEQDIEQLRESGRPFETITFRSPVAGVIVEKTAVRGMRVMAGQTLYRIADLSTVWVEAEIYERDLSAVRIGTRAMVTVQAYPDRAFAGRVTYISPIVTPETRTVRARITLRNSGGLLKPWTSGLRSPTLWLFRPTPSSKPERSGWSSSATVPVGLRRKRFSSDVARRASSR
jgi:Cu(I)/Ag(I) efflux system membrane fusion protein